MYEQALGERAVMLRDKLGVDVIAHRQLQRSLVYMAWFVELSGETEPEQGHPAVEAAADNAILALRAAEPARGSVRTSP